MPRPTRAHVALVILGGTLAIFGLLVLQVFLPLVGGLWGVVAVAALDLSLFLVYRHRRVARPVASGYVLTVRGLEDRRVAQQRANAEARKAAGIVFVVLFVVGMYLLGWIAQVVAMTNGSEFGLYLLGSLLYLIGAVLIIVVLDDYFTWGLRAIRLESTDDN